MKVKCDIKCEGCGFKTLVNFKKPDHWTPSTVNFVCSGCESDVYAVIKKDKTDRKKVSIQTKIKNISETLQSLIDEEKLNRIEADREKTV